MSKKIKRPIRFIARKNTDPIGTITEYNKAGLSKKTFPGTYGKKKSVTDIPTKTSPQKKILFTGLDKADFKMGDKMIKVVRDTVKKYGKENVTLVHGGRTNKSIVDANIEKLGKHTGVKVQSDPIDTSKRNASKIRLQKRIDDPDLTWYSFDKKGNLSKKDKYETWARDTYKNLKSETTYRIGSKKGYIGPKFSGGSDKGKGRSQETSKFKSFLDILEDEKNPDKVKSGIKYAQKVSKWSEEKVGHPLINEKNQPRIDYIESGKGLPTGKKYYQAIEDFGKATYIEDVSQSTETSNPRINKKLKNIGAILTGKKDKAPPTNVDPKYLDAPKKFKGGADTYSKSSSLAQFGNVEQAEPIEHKEAQRKALQDPKLDSDIDVGEDSSRSGKGVERHKGSHLRKQGVKEKLELRDIKRFGPIFDSLYGDFKKAKTGKERKAIDRRAKTILTQMSDIYSADAAPESTAGGDTIGKGRGQQSVTFTDIKSPSPHYEREKPKKLRIKASLKKSQKNPLVEKPATKELTKRTPKKSKFVRLPSKLPLGKLGLLIAPTLALSSLKAKKAKASVKNIAQETASVLIGNERVFGSVGKKGYFQNVGLTKKGVSGKRRPNLPIKGAGGKDTPFAKFMNWRKKNQAITRQIKY